MLRIYIILITALALQGTTAQVSNSKVFDIIKRYDATLVSPSHPAGIQTIIRKGRHTEGDKQFELTLTRKASYKIRYEYILDGIETIIAYNGETGWQRLQRGDSVSILDYVPSDYDWLRQSADLRGHLLRALSGEVGIEIRLLESEVIEGRAMHVIFASDDLDYSLKYYLNALSHYLEKVDILDSEGKLLEETYFSDYRLVGGIPMAGSIKTIKNDGEETLYVWDDIKINETVYDFFFEKPKF
jgi:hypothetical protein